MTDEFRNRRHGEMRSAQCSTVGCQTSATRRGMCGKHYQAWRRVEMTGPCDVAGCESPAFCRSLCPTHYQRARKHGSTEVVLKGNFKATGASYRNAHERMRTRIGPARIHECLFCDERADEWAYSGLSECEQTELSPAGYVLRFSLRPSDYLPLCVPCHRQYDADLRIERRAAA